MFQPISYTVSINATPLLVWETLTNPERIKGWIADVDMPVELITDWVVGNPIVINGFHHVDFENRGTVLQFDPPKNLQYNVLSSLSQLPDLIENYSILAFELTPVQNYTSLTVTIRNFPTEAICKHLDFYWKVTLMLIKNQAERQQ